MVNSAWQTRQRRQQTAADGKSKIPPVVGPEHLKLGRWLTASIVGITLVAYAYSIYFKGIFKELSSEKVPQAIVIVLLFLATVASLIFLYQARSKLWRGVFATLTGAGLVILGFQDGVFRRDYEWQFSHFYYGLVAALLMVFALAIVPEIYQDRSGRWRTIHTLLNCLAVLLFISQGMTGTRDLLEIPLSWQEPYIFKCDFGNKNCPELQQSQTVPTPQVFSENPAQP